MQAHRSGNRSAPGRSGWIAALAGLLAACALSCSGAPAPGPDSAAGSSAMPVIRADTPERLAKFQPTRIRADHASLSSSEQKALEKIIEASRLMNDIFLRQAWAENPGIREKLAGSDEPLARKALQYFAVNFGPWDRLDETPFVGEQPRPDGAGFYPPDLTRAGFDQWLEEHPEDEEAFKGLFTVIRRRGDGLEAVPYSREYGQWLEPAANLLREAAQLTENASLRSFLEKRADSFLSDDYYDSDMAWMDLDSVIEVTIGPYETYEDRLFGYKAAFESFVTVQDPNASGRLAGYKNELPGMERNLPIPDEHKNLNRGTESPIRVVDVVYTAGDTRAAVQTVAYNLPNDERVREAKGSKKVLLRNVMDAKLEAILKPIAERVIAPGQRPNVTAEAFFNEVLFHELSHGLGPGKIVKDGKETEARLELKDLYSALEEAKADVMGAYNILYLIDKGQFPESMRRDLYVTLLAGMFRGVRFGIEEAHGKGVALQYNYLKEKGAILHDPESGFFSVDFDKMGPALREIVHDLCMLQALGDYEGAKKMLDDYVKIPGEWREGLDRLTGIPVDIRPIYPAAGENG